MARIVKSKELQITYYNLKKLLQDLVIYDIYCRTCPKYLVRRKKDIEQLEKSFRARRAENSE